MIPQAPAPPSDRSTAPGSKALARASASLQQAWALEELEVNLWLKLHDKEHQQADGEHGMATRHPAGLEARSLRSLFAQSYLQHKHDQTSQNRGEAEQGNLTDTTLPAQGCDHYHKNYQRRGRKNMATPSSSVASVGNVKSEKGNCTDLP
eukprot:CAMPEP_0169151582 /NCGR_PEP_ID=MMETSP1015-20121227/50936_1 /TAXON_ID=342587 /ORGANISM="Karlodinium micrum, Strain CCMP2283" /LENGTH=149 /DNA_ID=CAMNT_0009221077 /DNA_START=140 /DNA_END=591 /DNA_ORIENTATION=+